MNYYELLMTIYILLGILGLLFIAAIIKKWHDIMAFFFPQKYAMITMLEADNNVSEWLQKKNSTLTFKFNDGVYHMFDLSTVKNPDPKENSLPPVLIKKRTAIYRNGALGQFFYNEGNEDPIDFRSIESTSNPQLSEQLEKTEAAALFIGSENDFLSILFKYIIPVLAIILLVAVIFLLTRNSQPAQATGQAATNSILNR